MMEVVRVGGRELTELQELWFNKMRTNEGNGQQVVGDPVKGQDRFFKQCHQIFNLQGIFALLYFPVILMFSISSLNTTAQSQQCFGEYRYLSYISLKIKSVWRKQAKASNFNSSGNSHKIAIDELHESQSSEKILKMRREVKHKKNISIPREWSIVLKGIRLSVVTQDRLFHYDQLKIKTEDSLKLLQNLWPPGVIVSMYFNECFP